MLIVNELPQAWNRLNYIYIFTRRCLSVTCLFYSLFF